MSLINDALKRAKQAHKDNPPPTPDLQFRPPDPAQRRSSGPPMLLIVAVVVVFALIGLFVVVALRKREPVPSVANARQTSTPVMQTTAVPAANSGSAAALTRQTTQTNPAPTVALSRASIEAATLSNLFASSASTDAATNVTTVADSTPPKPAVPKLQGIFYRPERPSAVINGKNVYVGSRVGELQVLAITQESVTIASATQTNVLSLGE